MTERSWQTYEEVANHLISEMRHHFGLKAVEREQRVSGHRSGTTYKIEGKGVLADGAGFFIIECRRYTTSKQKQEHLAALAYRIIDTRAAGGIVVTPIGLQEGAKKIAAAENVIELHLTPNSTMEDYVLAFLDQVFVGTSETINVGESTIVVKRGADGNVIERIDSPPS